MFSSRQQSSDSVAWKEVGLCDRPATRFVRSRLQQNVAPPPHGVLGAPPRQNNSLQSSYHQIFISASNSPLIAWQTRTPPKRPVGERNLTKRPQPKGVRKPGGTTQQQRTTRNNAWNHTARSGLDLLYIPFSSSTTTFSTFSAKPSSSTTISSVPSREGGHWPLAWARCQRLLTTMVTMMTEKDRSCFLWRGARCGRARNTLPIKTRRKKLWNLMLLPPSKMFKRSTRCDFDIISAIFPPTIDPRIDSHLAWITT